MKLWKRIGRLGESSADTRPWIASAIINSINGRPGSGAPDDQEWQCARAPAFVLMFRSRRRTDRRAAPQRGVTGATTGRSGEFTEPARGSRVRGILRRVFLHQS